MNKLKAMKYIDGTYQSSLLTMTGISSMSSSTTPVRDTFDILMKYQKQLKKQQRSSAIIMKSFFQWCKVINPLKILYEGAVWVIEFFRVVIISNSKSAITVADPMQRRQNVRNIKETFALKKKENHEYKKKKVKKELGKLLINKKDHEYVMRKLAEIEIATEKAKALKIKAIENGFVGTMKSNDLMKSDFIDAASPASFNYWPVKAISSYSNTSLVKKENTINTSNIIMTKEKSIFSMNVSNIDSLNNTQNDNANVNEENVFVHGEWDLFERRRVSFQEKTISETLFDNVSFSAYGIVTSELNGSTGIDWKVRWELSICTYVIFN